MSGIFAVLAYFQGPPLQAQNIPTVAGTGDIISAFRAMLIVSFGAVMLLSLQAIIGHYAPTKLRRAGPVERIYLDTEFGQKEVYVAYRIPEIKFLIKGMQILAGSFVFVVLGLAVRIALRVFTGI